MSTATPSNALTTGDRLPFWSAVGIIAQREIMVRLRSKAFVISSIIFVLGILATVVIGSVGPQLFDDEPTVAVTSETEDAVAAVGDLDIVPVASDAEARDLVASGDASAAVLASSSASGMTVVAEREVPSSLVQALSVSPDVELLDADAPHPALTYFIGFGFGIVFFMSALTFGGTIAQSVVEEKQTRIVEILLATVPARALLAGKILGNSVMAFAQIALTAAVVLIASAVLENRLLLDGLGMPIAWFVVLFTVGFVLIASLYAATAALVSRVEDLASATSPVMTLVMIPYFLVIIFNNNPTVLAVMSYIPFSAPVAVPMRVFLGTAEWWEPIVSFAVVVVTTVVVVLVSARMYERSLLRTGSRVKLREALGSRG